METEGHTLQDREANSIMVFAYEGNKVQSGNHCDKGLIAAVAALGDSKQTMMCFKHALCTKKSYMADGEKCWEAIAESGGETM